MNHTPLLAVLLLAGCGGIVDAQTVDPPHQYEVVANFAADVYGAGLDQRTVGACLPVEPRKDSGGQPVCAVFVGHFAQGCACDNPRETPPLAVHGDMLAVAAPKLEGAACVCELPPLTSGPELMACEAGDTAGPTNAYCYSDAVSWPVCPNGSQLMLLFAGDLVLEPAPYRIAVVCDLLDAGTND